MQLHNLNAPAGISLDIVNGELAVANSNGNTISVFTTALFFVRSIGGPATGIGAPPGVAIDAAIGCRPTPRGIGIPG